MTQEEVLKIFKESGALLDGHFKLTSGLHSPQYFQCAQVLQYPMHAQKLCWEIACKFMMDKISVVIAPAVGGIVVSQEVA
ncbi:orotate phosphoribosyltransferase, partial [candidate division KSB1 bacterium]|nr:orotate phosphoribosyltransferase [candidate division KSB1 bacterium]